MLLLTQHYPTKVIIVAKNVIQVVLVTNKEPKKKTQMFKLKVKKKKRK